MISRREAIRSLSAFLGVKVAGVETLHVEPRDVVVLKFKHSLRPEDVARLRNIWRENFAGKVLILDEDADIKIIKGNKEQV